VLLRKSSNLVHDQFLELGFSQYLLQVARILAYKTTLKILEVYLPFAEPQSLTLFMCGTIIATVQLLSESPYSIDWAIMFESPKIFSIFSGAMYSP
jgi:hypothetical protein